MQNCDYSFLKTSAPHFFCFSIEPFSNQERPTTHPIDNITRPFTGKMQAGSKFQQVQSAIAKAGMDTLNIEKQGSALSQIQKIVPPASAGNDYKPFPMTEVKDKGRRPETGNDEIVGGGLFKVPMIGGIAS